jgi:hypothetical protein
MLTQVTDIEGVITLGRREMAFSDLTGQLAEEDALGKVVVLDHPDLSNGPVVFEALPDELRGLLRQAVTVRPPWWNGSHRARKSRSRSYFRSTPSTRRPSKLAE